MSQALKQRNAKSLLILGTSDNMVNQIAKRLGLDGVDKTIYITDISSPYEIQQAINTRRTEGKHVIPVPTLEIKKDFSGFMLDPLNIIRRKGMGSYESMGEKSVVRPTFSYLGKYIISEYTIFQLADHISLKSPFVSRISRFRTETAMGYVKIEIDYVLFYGCNIPELFKQIKKDISEEIEKLTSLNIGSMILTAQSIVVPKK